MKKFFSIIIITRNRAGIIANVLQTIKWLEFPRDQFEVVVVDNGSEDGTANAVSRVMEASDINWRIIFEPVPGLCSARNAGLATAKGKWIAFLDDDALIQTDWLDAYQQAINRYPEAAALGGPASLDPRIPRPWWWCKKFDVTMSCQDYGEIMMPYRKYAHPYGLNMVFNRHILDKYHGFDVTLDAIIPGLADETDLFFRMMKNMELVIYVPKARVVHALASERLRWKAFSKRCIHVGRTFACLDSRYHTRTHRSLLRRLVSATLDFAKHKTAVLFLKEYLEWYGYVNFDRSLLHNDVHHDHAGEES